MNNFFSFFFLVLDKEKKNRKKKTKFGKTKNRRKKMNNFFSFFFFGFGQRKNKIKKKTKFGKTKNRKKKWIIFLVLFFFSEKLLFEIVFSFSQNVFWIDCGSWKHKKKFLKSKAKTSTWKWIVCFCSLFFCQPNSELRSNYGYSDNIYRKLPQGCAPVFFRKV